MELCWGAAAASVTSTAATRALILTILTDLRVVKTWKKVFGLGRVGGSKKEDRFRLANERKGLDGSRKEDEG